MTDGTTSPAGGVNPASLIVPPDPVMGEPQSSNRSTSPAAGDTAAQSQAQPATGNEDPAAADGANNGQGDNKQHESKSGRNRQTAQQRISELTARLRQTQTERNAAIAKAERLSRPIQTQRNPADLSFEEAEELRMRNAVRKENASQAELEARIRDDQALRHRNAVFAAKVEAAAERMPDLWQRFDQVPCSQFAADFITGSDKTVELAHYLASNPREAAAIARMPDAHAGIALARIEGRLQTAPASRRVTTAPPPPTRVTGGTASGAKSPADMTYEEYVDWANKRGF